jgi:hypothetical protein
MQQDMNTPADFATAVNTYLQPDPNNKKKTLARSMASKGVWKQYVDNYKANTGVDIGDDMLAQAMAQNYIDTIRTMYPTPGLETYTNMYTGTQPSKVQAPGQSTSEMLRQNDMYSPARVLPEGPTPGAMKDAERKHGPIPTLPQDTWQWLSTPNYSSGGK